MPNQKDILKALSGRLNNQALSTALAASDENVELGDEEFNAIVSDINNLMTVEAARNSEDILNHHIDSINKGIDSPAHKALKNKMLFKAEKMIEEFGSNIGVDLKDKRLDDQMGVLNSNIDKFKGGSDNEALEASKQEITKLHEKLTLASQENERIKTKHKEDIENITIDTLLKNELDKVKLATPYQDDVIKRGIYKNAMDNAKSKATFKLSPDNTLIIRQKSNPELELFDGNTKIEKAEQLLMPSIK